jgi:enoyl-CoA hydratase/carnithine racemase
VAPDLILTGRRLTGIECAANNVVSGAYPNDELMDRVMAFSKGLNKGRWIVGQMKQVLNSRIIRLMEDDKAILKQGDVRV